MGDSAALYNLDATGNQATVLVEYSVVNPDNGATTTWLPLSGGSIAQGSVTYALDSSNTDGVYAVPQNPSSASLGSAQDDVAIYAEIPDQADYNLVAVRLTLRTDSAEYAPQITNLDPEQAPVQVSDAFSAPAPAGYTFPYTASVRFFPATAYHDFNTDKPVIQLGDADGLDKISFNVPVSVPRYFRSVVETSGAGTVSGTATTVGNDDAAESSNVTGLSYVPTADQTFALTVSYEYSENTTVSSDPQAMSVQMQGFPNPTDKGFTIVSASWNKATQELEYELDITATATSAVRMDGWNVYTKLSTETAGWPVDEALVSSGLTHSVSLSSLAYPYFSIIDVKVVATRSKYLDSADTNEQTETNSDNVLDAGIQTTQITILPNTLPKPAASDIVLTNIVYDENAASSQSATLTVTVPSIATGVRVTNTSDSSTSTSTTQTISITSTPTEYTFTIEYKYDSTVTGSVTTTYSAPTTLSFTTGLSNASTPVITSKAYVDESTFPVTYTSTDSSYTSADMVLTSTVEALSVGSSDPAVNLGSNDGSVNLISFKGLNVNMYISNSFAYNYYVDEQAVPGTQVVQSDAVTFYVAANPAIGSSIAVDATLHTVTFSVHNNGAPNFNLALIVITQDSSTAQNDSGTYAIALFSAAGGFEVGTSYANTISGGAAHTLTVSGITGADYATVTSFTFQSASDLTTADANVVVYVANTIEGADSVATNVTPTVPPLIQLAANGTTIQYTGTAEAIPSTEPLFLEANPRGTGLEWFAVVNNSSKSMLTDYANNLSSGPGFSYFTNNGSVVLFKNIVTTLMTDMSSLFENVNSFNGDISSWDTSNVTTMSRMFRNDRAFNINIGDWDVGNVLDMSRMFETDPADPWSMFNNGGSGDIGNWNTSEVTDMSNMFASAKSFNQNIIGWNISKVTTRVNMFAGAQSFNLAYSPRFNPWGF